MSESKRYPYHLKRADVILDLLRRYPYCETDADRADTAFDRELLAQHLADIETSSTPEPAVADRATLTNLADYLETTAANCEDLHDVAWKNSEVLEMVGQIRALLAPALVTERPSEPVAEDRALLEAARSVVEYHEGWPYDSAPPSLSERVDALKAALVAAPPDRYQAAPEERS